jgi:hypothetical protein
MEYTEKIINVATGEETIRPYTADEIAEVEAAIAEGEKVKTEIKMAADAKATAKAELLERLGITAEEAALLLG